MGDKMSEITTSTIDANNLTPKTVIDILKENYYIPAYQRGYRWTETQVLQLLNDIDFFKVITPLDGEKEPYYCLQPVVVKLKDDHYEVIDGQQRLTTIAIFIHYYNNIYNSKKRIREPIITYDTRLDSAKFIESLDIIGPEEFNPKWKRPSDAFNDIQISCGEFKEDDNIDFFHIAQAFKTIHYWFLQKGESYDETSIRSKILNHSKVIWYEVEDNQSNNSVDIFTRLNIGKIPLTNGELIKALFLMSSNFGPAEVSLRQIQIASEWDSIEKALQDDSFWGFIYNPKNPIKYDNRIEYLFDLMKGRTKDSEFYFTFNEFHAEFERTTLNGKPDIDTLWLSVKRLFLTFEEWFRDYELYHYVGFLIGCSGDRSLDCINMLRELSKNDKDVFKVKLKEEIKKQIPDDIESLEYGNKQIRSVLLLFNIVTVLQTQKSDMRFPFNRYKAENWDIEHVNSQTDQVITEDSRQRLWADDLLDYFVGATDSDSVMAYISDDNEDVNQTRKDFCRRILAIKEAKKIDDNDFDTLFKEIQVFFHEEKFSNKDNLYNLALLDANTNRSYGNAFFPIKRKRIIDNDSKGIFVPIATKNLFLKYYSTVSDNIMYWTEKDAADYLEAIKSVFSTFFSNPSEK